MGRLAVNLLAEEWPQWHIIENGSRLNVSMVELRFRFLHSGRGRSAVQTGRMYFSLFDVGATEAGGRECVQLSIPASRNRTPMVLSSHSELSVSRGVNVRGETTEATSEGPAARADADGHGWNESTPLVCASAPSRERPPRDAYNLTARQQARTVTFVLDE